MTDKVMYWLSMLFSGIAVLLVVLDMAMVSGNRALQIELNSRQMSIDNAVRLSQLNQNLAQALAEASLKNNDKEIRDLLYSQGITIKDKEKDKDKDSSDSSQAKKK